MYPESDWRDERDGDLRPNYKAELSREWRWQIFEARCRDFASEERDGFAAVLRAVARAMNSEAK